MTQVFTISGITIFVYMIIIFLIAQRISNNSIVDIGWGLGFVLTTLVLIFSSSKIYPSMLILSFMILIWGIRLSFYIFLRNAGKPEDFRYSNWRKEWGNRQPYIAFFKIFMLQGIILYIVAFPILFVFASPQEMPGPSAISGILIFLSGLGFEGLADAQMKRFKSNPENKGKIITTGLWKYSRHPNYFGEASLWWGIGIYAFSFTGKWFCFISPLLITILLRYVSGVPMLEEKYKDREDFRIYCSKTSVFIPFIGKKSLP